MYGACDMVEPVGDEFMSSVGLRGSLHNRPNKSLCRPCVKFSSCKSPKGGSNHLNVVSCFQSNHLNKER